jgi:signal transduction histidine kinase
MNVKLNLSRLSEHYQAALRVHLDEGACARLQPALLLGREAVGLGLETLELARIHEQAIAKLELPSTKNAMLKRAEKFFYEANSLIEETHRAARKSTAHLGRLKETLDQRTAELAATNRQLKRVVVRRKVMQDALDKNGNHYKSSLEESLQLQKRLRQLTHRVMATQENERSIISRELQDEIAQTLLGINVRLLSLKREAQHHSAGIKSEIASTQRLVVRSAKSVRRVAREINGK